MTSQLFPSTTVASELNRGRLLRANSRRLVLSIAFWAFSLSIDLTLGHAQHDPHRDTVRHIAKGQLDQAEARLADANPDDAETHFVRMLLALERGEVADGVHHAQKALQGGLPFERLLAGPHEVLQPLYATDEFQSWQNEREIPSLLHGPMIGSVTDNAATVWVRTTRPARVAVRIIDSSTDQEVIGQSDEVQSGWDSDRTAVAGITGLKPDRVYRYRVLVDGKPASGGEAEFRTFPSEASPARFTIGFGGGAGYAPARERIWDTIRERDPLAFLMLGDNVYIDDPKHSLTSRYCYYRRQSRPEWRRLVASRGMYAIYDDHDFGTNDCIPGPEIDDPPWKREVWERFRQNWVNPAYGGGDEQPGCWHDFHVGDVHFILLDGRYYRTREGQPSMLGPVQLGWLMRTLKASPGTFKVIASPVPFSPGVKPGSDDPWDGFPEERETIFRFVEQEKIDGVFLIAADRHRTDLRVTARSEGYDLVEFESSRLSNRHTHRVIETPGLVWGYNETCSFGLMIFDTASPDPSVEFRAVSIEGEVVHDYRLPLSELVHNE